MVNVKRIKQFKVLVKHILTRSKLPELTNGMDISYMYMCPGGSFLFFWKDKVISNITRTCSA